MSNPQDRARRAAGSTDGASPVGEHRKKRPWWLLVLVGLALVALVVFLLSRCGGDDTDTANTAADATSAVPTVSDTPAVTASPTAEPSASTTGAPTGDGTLTAGSADVLPLSAAGVPASGDLSQYTGQAVTGKGATVQSVPADEGFWVGSSNTDRVWVQLDGPGESPFKVTAGQKVNFTGTMTAVAAGFPAKVGVTDAEGAAQITAQKQYVKVVRSSLALFS